MSILTIEAKSDQKQWCFKLWQSKYRFLEVGLNMLIRCSSNITLQVGIGAYKQTGEETGQVEPVPCPCNKLNRSRKVCVPLGPCDLRTTMGPCDIC